ncbi:MAG: hypothetical protein Q9222_003750 [Ikaeria aurantiellina]
MATQAPLPDLSESYRPSLYSAAIITYTLAISAVALRFTARRLTHTFFWYDDWLVVVALDYETIVRDTFLNLFVEEIFYSTGIVAVSIILLVVYYKLDNTSADISWTISPIVLWAGTEINLGVVTTCLPSLRPIFLLIKTGSARPDTATKVSRQGNPSGTFKSKVTGTFLPRSRNATSFAEIEDGDDRNPFSISHDEENGKYAADGTVEHNSGIRLDEVQPPHDRVMVREDICVQYTHV